MESGNAGLTGRNVELVEAERALRGSEKDEEAFESYIQEYKNPRYARLLEETAAAMERSIADCEKQKSVLVEVRTDYLKNHPQRDFSASAGDNGDYEKLLAKLQCGELEAYKKKANAQAKSAVEHFKEDFIYKIRSAIREAYVRRDELNRIIRNLDFGKDRYQFRIGRSKGRDGEFYDMFMDEDLDIDPSTLSVSVDHQMNLFSMSHENKYGHMISELLDLFIPPENATAAELEEARKNMEKYADYRTYLSFEMEQIVEGDEQRLVIGLSKMIKKNSGGEGQNPLYIALLASFAQAYRINLSARASRRPTIRLVVLDEAFSKMDAEKTSETRCYCSPRDYIDYINQYLALFQQKRRQLEDQQHHLQVGLEKLHETEEQVLVLREQVAQKRQELDVANTEAQNKLQQILSKKEETTKNQEISQNLVTEVTAKYGEIAEKRARVNKQLSTVEPLLQEAQSSVKQISKAQLNEMRAMMKPPVNVQLTLRAVCYLIGENASTWSVIQKVIRKEDFINSIVNLDTSRITRHGAEEARNIMNTPGFDYTAVNHSSRACGPLYKWVSSQLEYSDIIQRVKPLNDEMELLTQTSEELRKKHDECMAYIAVLNKEIEGYSTEYGLLTQKCQRISEDIQVVTQKSTRSYRLLESLKSEQKRWKDSLEEFKKQLSSMIGDCLLGASFVTYGGFFDQHHRSLLLSEWKQLLSDLEIPFNVHFDAMGYLSTAKQRLLWKSNGLPADELCTQNAIILDRFSRYPLLIDPSSQGMQFLTNLYSSNRVIKTSFLDKSFMKQLESALRFGSILLVQDVENADPVLNPLLNKEFHKEGGRTLIRIGDQEVDVSPAFKLFLSTRDSFHQFSPDLCSRVTFVNFTMTPSSLQDQCLNIIFEKEVPELAKQRTDLLQEQGGMQSRLRDLEEELLSSLNSLQGNILDDDSVMNTLEQLKTDAQTITESIRKSEEAVQIIAESSRVYRPLSEACSQLYFVVEMLHRVSFLYRYNLQFFLDILHDVLQQPLDPMFTPRQRMNALLLSFYRTVYARISHGLTHLDARIFALRMCQLFVRGSPDEPEPEEYQLLLRGTLSFIDPSAEKFVTAIFGNTLSESQSTQMEMHLSLEHTTALKKSLLQRPDYWRREFLTAPVESLLGIADEVGESGWTRGRALWRWLLLIKELRPELLIAASELVVRTLFDADFFAGET